MVSTHSRLKAAGNLPLYPACSLRVSTHSRLKAAGRKMAKTAVASPSFNTQPPEGGWRLLTAPPLAGACFNTQPPEGGWKVIREILNGINCFNTQPPEGGWARTLPFCSHWRVSTHSRLKAAGIGKTWFCHTGYVSTHSRLKAAGTTCQPPSGGWGKRRADLPKPVGTTCQPPSGGWCLNRYRPPAAISLGQRASRLQAAGASLKSLVPSGFAALISLSSQEKRGHEYNTAFSVTPAFTIY